MTSATEIHGGDPTSPQRLHAELSHMIGVHMNNHIEVPDAVSDAATEALLRFAENVTALVNADRTKPRCHRCGRDRAAQHRLCEDCLRSETTTVREGRAV